MKTTTFVTKKELYSVAASTSYILTLISLVLLGVDESWGSLVVVIAALALALLYSGAAIRYRLSEKGEKTSDSEEMNPEQSAK